MGPWDFCVPTAWPRIGGGVLAGRDAEGHLWLCGGYLPCGRCAACQSGLLLGCEQPTRPGWNTPGGFASALRLAAGAAPADFAAQRLPQVVASIASAGLAYQAQVLAGMSPGDNVLVVGEAGSGALPLRLLSAGGLRPLWLGNGSPPEAVVQVSELRPDELPPARYHLIDLHPSAASISSWQALAHRCLTVSLLGPPSHDLTAPLAGLLAGQTCLRWICDLHPHLVLDLAALVVGGRLLVDDVVEVLARADAAAALQSSLTGTSQRWCVVC